MMKKTNENSYGYIVRGISVPFNASEDEAIKEAAGRLLKFFSKDDIYSLKISKRSVDSRKKSDIRFVYSVYASVTKDTSASPDVLLSSDIIRENKVIPEAVPGDEKLSSRPVIVGFGPCGMFCAYVLAKNGYCPIVIERGSDTDKRTEDFKRFCDEQILDTESNIQFGAGGAGTFSDGKLMTRTNDPYCKYIVETFHLLGAPENILYEAKPHVGTDYLKITTKNMQKQLESMGAEIHFNTKLEKVFAKNGGIYKIGTSKGEIECGALILAIGHSARDTVLMLENSGLVTVPKAFSVGVRIEHLQADIDRAMYGACAGNSKLPHAEYAISTNVKGRGVYTFCMCPGGNVVAAASEENGVVTNGMSFHSRNGKNANSAVCVSITPDDFGNSVNAAMDFVRKIEQKAFIIGGSNYYAPVQTVGSFLGRTLNNAPASVAPTYMNGKVCFTDIGKVFPEFITEALKQGIPALSGKLSGFSSYDALLTAPETRTSSPLRIIRNDVYRAEGYDNLYPCGEGAGYAGGITSAAADGIKCALEIISRYSQIR